MLNTKLAAAVAVKWQMGKGHRATASGDKSPPLHICKVLADESEPGKLPKTLLLSSASLRQDKLPCIKFYPKDKMLRHVNGTDWRVALSRIGFASLTWQQVTTWEREGVGVKDAYFTCSCPNSHLTAPPPPCDTVFRFPSAGYIKISSRTVLFLLPSSSHCHLFQCATVYCSFLQCIRLSALPLLLASYPRKKPSRRANKSCAQSVDINFVSLLFGQNCLQTMHRSNALLLSLFQQGQEKGRKGRVAAVSAVAKIRH